jgi:tetraacyldisaccharide 4'-kinase
MEFMYQPRSWRTTLLRPASWVYGVLVRLWHLAFDAGLRKPVRVPGAKVISVGNVVVGGSGKTPVVMYLANQALTHGATVAVLSRGYGRRSKEIRSFDSRQLPPVEEVGDEPRLIARRCPGATVWVGSNRVDLAQRAVAQGATVLILDDGFQHRQLARDVDVVVDGGEGNGLLLPAGPLREPASARRRATHIWGRDGRHGDFEAQHRLVGLRGPDGVVEPPEVLQGRAVVLLLGVARPELVVAAVKALGALVRATHACADHHLFSAQEIDRAQREASGAWLVTTEKDAERLPSGSAHVLILDVQVTKGPELFW